MWWKFYHCRWNTYGLMCNWNILTYGFNLILITLGLCFSLSEIQDTAVPRDRTDCEKWILFYSSEFSANYNRSKYKISGIDSYAFLPETFQRNIAPTTKISTCIFRFFILRFYLDSCTTYWGIWLNWLNFVQNTWGNTYSFKTVSNVA